MIYYRCDAAATVTVFIDVPFQMKRRKNNKSVLCDLRLFIAIRLFKRTFCANTENKSDKFSWRCV